VSQPSPSPDGFDSAVAVGPPESTVGPTDALEPWPATVDWRPVSARLIWIKEIQLAIEVVAILAACALAAAFFGGALPWLTAIAAVVLGVARAVLVVRSVRSWGYAERHEDLLVRHGLLVRRLSIVPYGRMQFVDVTAGPLERAFGLATVTLHTAAAHSDATVPGLPGPEAARLRDRLAALGEARAEGL
jgi:membrane protein YdbS with pleckstrin-like domain